ncbi:MAG: FAD-dependent oxidoreductase [Fimbriimonas sp.]|nr:FAD-dependent oxidoreductase [Fimbriimonas sp.]
MAERSVTEVFDGIVVGGGIVGCACAYYLSERFPKVLLIEKGPVGGGSTAAGMGHVVVMDDSRAQFALTQYSQQLWNELFPQLEPSCEPRSTGTLWVAADEEEFSHVDGKRKLYESNGLRAEVLDTKAIREAEPHLREGLPGGLLIPGDSVIYPMTAAAWLLDQARLRGAKLLQGRAVVKMGQGKTTLDDGTTLDAHFVVNATGDRAQTLTPGLPITPRKGHLIITDRYPGYVRHQLVELGYLKSAHEMSNESVAFNAQPRATGQILLGSSRQFVGWDPGIDRNLIAKMVARATEYLPGIGSLSVIRTWVGFRATTPNSLPLIGSLQHDPATLVAAGHEGLGITTSLATGKLIADIASGVESKIDRNPFAVSVEVKS